MQNHTVPFYIKFVKTYHVLKEADKEKISTNGPFDDLQLYKITLIAIMRNIIMSFFNLICESSWWMIGKVVRLFTLFYEILFHCSLFDSKNEERVYKW